MVFGADWDEPLTPDQMQGRAFTSAELRMSTPIVIPSRCHVETIGDETVCVPCRERNGKPLVLGERVDDKRCVNPNGCRCLAVVTVI